MGEYQLSRPNAVLIASFPIAALFVLDGFFRAALHSQSPALFWVFDIFKFLLLPVGILIWLAWKFRVTPSRYGMRALAENESWAHFLGLIVFLAIVLSLIYHTASVFAWVIVRPPEATPFFKAVIPDGLFRFPVVLYLAVTAGVVEEIFFRALPLLYVSERFPGSAPAGTYVVTTALLFGAAHWENGTHEVVATFIYGVFAAAFYLKLRDLWPLIGAHVLIDVWEFW